MSVPDDGILVGAHFGLTPKRYQSGETVVVGRITKVGGGMVRSLLYEAAHTMLTRSCRFFEAQALGHGGSGSGVVASGRRWHWPASSRSCCYVSG
jgi:transposase